MEETKNSQIAEETSSVEPTTTSGDSVDYEAQYNAEVSNAMKQRKRAQDAETELKKIQDVQEKARIKKLAEEGKLNEVVDSLKSQNEKLANELSQNTGIIDVMRQELLAKVSEDEQESLKDLPFNTLKMVIEKISAKTKADLPNTTPGLKTPAIPDKPYAQMTDAERRQYHTSIVEGRKS